MTKRNSGDHIDVGNIENSIVAIGEGASVTVYGGVNFYKHRSKLDTLPLDLRTNIQNFLTTYLGTETRPVPFGGRDDDLDRLERWRLQSEKRFLLLATPAGRGKSALLARWAYKLSQSEMSKDVSAIFVPVSIRFNTNLAERFFPSIAVQLAELLEQEIPSNYIDMAPSLWQNLVSEYLRRPLPDGRQLLLIVDGLDEAAWDIGPDLFPLDLPESTRIVVSARYLAGDSTGSKAWLRRLGWQQLQLSESMSLERLTQGGVREVLLQTKGLLHDSDNQEAMVKRLYDLTSGDPLLVKLYCDWVQEEKEKGSIPLSVADLNSIEPDYEGFFLFWWEGQEKLWRQKGQADPLEKRIVIALLKILSTALGPLTLKDLQTLLPSEFGSSKYQLHQALKPLNRFIIGDWETTGFSLAHARLGDFFRNEFLDQQEMLVWQQAFIQWGQQVIDQLVSDTDPNFDNVSRYLLHHYSYHLANAETQVPVEKFLSLLTWEWMNSWYQYSKTYAGFLRDVDVALDKVVEENQKAIEAGQSAVHIDREIFCVLCHTSINSLSSKIPAELLLALLRHTSWTDEQVLAYARRNTNPKEKAKALLVLAPYLVIENREYIFREVLQLALGIEDENSRAILLSDLAPHLPHEVFEATQAQAILNFEPLLEIMTELAPYMPEEILVEIETWDSDWWQAKGFIVLAPHLPDKERKQVLNRALHTAQGIKDQRDLALTINDIRQAIDKEKKLGEILTDLAPHLPEAVYDEGSTVQFDYYLTGILEALAPHLPEAVYKAVKTIFWHSKTSKVPVLMALAPHLPEEERNKALNQALQITQNIYDEEHRSYYLRSLAPQLPEIVYKAALAIEYEARRARVLAALAPHLPTQVYEAALAIEDEITRMEILLDLAPHIPEGEQTEAVYLALQTAQTIKDEENRAEYLAAYAQYFPEAVLEAAKSIQDNGPRARILEALARHLAQEESSEVLNQALQMALAMENEHVRARVLAAFAPHFPEAICKAAHAIEYEGSLAEVLQALAPYLAQGESPEALVQALQMAQVMEDELARAYVLAAFAPYLPETIYKAAPAIEDEGSLAEVLEALAPYLAQRESLDALNQALQMALIMENEHVRARVMAAFAPHLPEAVYEAAQAIENKKAQAEVLTALAPHLPEMVYEAAQAIDDEESQTIVLTALAPHLAETLLETAQISWDIKPLAALAPHQPEMVFREAQTIKNKRWVQGFSTIDIDSILASIFSALAPYMPEVVYEAAQDIQFDSYRAKVMTALVPYMPEVVYNAAQDLEDDWIHASLLMTLVPYLQEEEGVQIFKQSLRIMQADDNQEYWIWKSGDLSDHLVTYSNDRLYHVWEDYLSVVKRLDRSETMNALKEFLPVIKALGGKESLGKSLEAIELVCRWWP